MQTKTNLKGIIHTTLIVVSVVIISYFITGLSLLVTGIGDKYAGNDFDWSALLNDENRTFSISCEEGIYMLRFTPADEKSKTAGVFIGSSSTDLRAFCNKEVKIKATGRAFHGKPLCDEQLYQEKPVFCSGTRPVVDIHEITLLQ